MDQHVINGASLNGGINRLVLATAIIACAATLSVDGIRNANAAATISGASTVQSVGTCYRNALASIQGVGSFYPTGTHTAAASTNFVGTANISSYVLREIPSSVTFNTVATIVAIPSSTIGAATLTGTANVVASGTRVQATASSLSAGSQVTINIAPVIDRKASASVIGTGSVRAEYAFLALADGIPSKPAYWDASGIAELTANAVCYRITTASLSGQVTGSAIATVLQPAFSVAAATGSLVTAEPNIYTSLLANLSGTCHVSCAATINKISAASIDNSAQVTSAAKMRFAGVCTYLGEVTIVASAANKSLMFANSSSSASVVATVLRTLMPECDITGTATVIANANTNSLTYCNATGISVLIIQADQINARRASANTDFSGSVEVVAVPAITHTTQGSFNGACVVTSSADDLNVRRVQGQLSVVSLANVISQASINHAAAVVISIGNVITTTAEDLNTRRVVASSLVQGSASVSSLAGLIKQAASTFTGDSAFDALADTTVRQAIVDITGSAQSTSSGVAYRLVEASIESILEISAVANRIVFPVGISIGGSAMLIADMVSNPASIDPPERTFIRVADLTDFTRPFVETEFQRAV